MTQLLNDLVQFHEAAEQVVNVKPTFPDQETIDLRKRLIMEEVYETLEAIDGRDMEETADGIADSIYVLIGTAVSFGIPLDRVWNEVQRSNMAKFPVNEHGERRAIRDAGGKVMKPEGWTKPDIKGALYGQG